MRRFAICIAVVTLAAGLLPAECASAAAGSSCGNSAFHSTIPVREGSVWRMEVLVDEAAYTGPSIRDRLNHHWNQQAKRNHRWTSAVMPIDAGTLTRLMTVSAAVIEDGVPVLEKGDIVDVFVVPRSDYCRGRVPVIVRRICGGRDERCLDGLRRMQEGREAGVQVGGGGVPGGYRCCSPAVAIRCCFAPTDGHHGVAAAALQ